MCQGRNRRNPLWKHITPPFHKDPPQLFYENRLLRGPVKPGEIVWAPINAQGQWESKNYHPQLIWKIDWCQVGHNHCAPWSQAVGPFDKKYCSTYPTERTNEEISIPITAKVQQPKVQASWPKSVARWAGGKLPKQTLTSQLPLFLWIISPARHFMKLWDNSCTMVFLRIVSRSKWA